MQETTMLNLREMVRGLQIVTGQVREDTNAAVRSGDHVELVRHYRDLKDTNDLIKEAREALSEMADLLSTRDIPEAFRKAGVKTTTIEGVGRVTVSYRFSCSMLDKELGMAWLRSNGHEGLIQPTVNAQTLGAFAKNLIETEGKDLPDDIFKTGQSPYTSINKVK
jgi:hypothetical protein